MGRPRVSNLAALGVAALLAAVAAFLKGQGLATFRAGFLVQGVGVGAGVGAVAGALLGQAIGHDRESTLIGAAAGAVLGAGGSYLWSQQMQQQKIWDSKQGISK